MYYFQVKDLIKAHIKVARDVGVQSASRLYTGPEVQGCRPVLVTFENFKDKEDVFQASKLLRKSVISVTEDFSKKTREVRQELRKFMRHVKRTNPEKRCHLQYDKLFIDGKIFLYNEALGQVEEIGKNTSNSRYRFHISKQRSIYCYCRPNLIESNGDLKCCDSLISLQETWNKDIDAKIEKQFSKRTKLNSSLPSLPSLNEDIDEIMANKIVDLEKQLKERDDIIFSQLKLINDQKNKILKTQNDYEDDFEDF